MEKSPLGVYIHIPFCIKKCNYCDFLSAPGDERSYRDYVSALVTQIGKAAPDSERYRLRTVYIGGGTPSVLPSGLMREITDALFSAYACRPESLLEFTIEVNPGTVSAEKLSAYRHMGANRLSIGIQSADAAELALLGRIHSFDDAKKCVSLAREEGFKNISVDVISALPGQTCKTYAETLDRVTDLYPEHISAYSLIVEEGTPFWNEYGPYGTKKDRLPDDETERRMYELTKEKLLLAGYRRYEISNYAKPGFESIHNSSYWTGIEYRGFGSGASSFMNNVRFSGTRVFRDYLADPCASVTDEILSEKDLMTEFMILGLRMTKGVTEEQFLLRFGCSVDSVFKDSLDRNEKYGLIVRKNGKILLTERGTDVSNAVFESFL